MGNYISTMTSREFDDTLQQLQTSNPKQALIDCIKRIKLNNIAKDKLHVFRGKILECKTLFMHKIHVFRKQRLEELGYNEEGIKQGRRQECQHTPMCDASSMQDGLNDCKAGEIECDVLKQTM